MNILMLVEDNPSDFVLASRAFKSILPDVNIIHCKSGEEALVYLEDRKLRSAPHTLFLE